MSTVYGNTERVSGEDVDAGAWYCIESQVSLHGTTMGMSLRGFRRREAVYEDG